jgi:hypothetical protein
VVPWLPERRPALQPAGTDPVTASFLTAARHYGIPVVGIYETTPVLGYDYWSWLLTEITALRKPVTTSSPHRD